MPFVIQQIGHGDRLYAREQVVQADASRASQRNGGCNRLVISVGRKSKNRLTCFVVGFGCNRHAIVRHGLRRLTPALAAE
jgi:hypothetical protein